MKNIIGIIQSFLIVGLLFICVVFALQLRSSNNTAQLNSKVTPVTPIPSPVLTNSTISGIILPTDTQDESPDFTKANNSPDEPQAVMDAIGIIREYKPTGYRVTKDKKNILYMNTQHMVMMNVETKEEKELLSFTKWKKNDRSNTNVCVPGSAFVDPMFNNEENNVYFGGPSEGRDALYKYPIGASEAQLIIAVENCISDIAVSTDENHIAYQSTKHFGTGAGYMTDLFLVQVASKNTLLIAEQGVLPQNSLTTSNDPVDFSPAQIVWTSPTIFYLQGFTGGVYSGVWKYSLNSNQFELLTNLKGGP